jgi:RimJ/RimL family protein N-acetyltransferase
VDTVDGINHVAFAAFLPNEPARLVGVGRALRYPDDQESLDVGVTVADDFQGNGLGRIFACLLAEHLPRPARRIITHVEPDNHRALSLLTAFGQSRRSADGSVIVDLPSPAHAG